MKNTYKINNSHVFFVGIGGISMSGLAKMVIDAGGRVSGSDITFNEELRVLQNLGANIYIGHNQKNISADLSLVVFTGAIKDDNPEIIQAKSLGLPLMERSEFLGIIASQYKHVIAVSGTHGKTTTTAMIAQIFEYAKFNPTIHIGGVSNNLGTNTKIGGKDYLIVEACEYRESFRFLTPDTLVITNIEADHLDYYQDLSDIKDAFARLSNKSNKIIKLDTIDIEHSNSISIGQDYRLLSSKQLKGQYVYSVFGKEQNLGEFHLNAIGKFNVTNSLFAIAVAIEYGVPLDIIKQALEKFAGVERRYEKIATINDIPVIIDYAHHPTELRNSIDGFKGVFNSPLIIFQPHTYSRTIKLFNDFVSVLSVEKNIVIFQTYPAREKEIVGGRAIDLFDMLDLKEKVYCTDVYWLVEHIKDKINNKQCDSVLILGAGDLAIKLKKLLNK